MAQDNKTPLYTLYESLKADNYDVPDTYDSFERTLTDKVDGTTNRMSLYKSLKADNYDVPDTYESFATTLFKPKRTSSNAVVSTPVSTPSTPVQTSTNKYYKLRRGGKDFTVSEDDVKAAGGLSGWAKANPGAPLRVYMQGNGFKGHVDLSAAHDSFKKKGYKYTTVTSPISSATATPKQTVQTPAQSAQPKSWRPSVGQQIAFNYQVNNAGAQIRQQREQMNQRMEGIKKGNRLDSGLGVREYNPQTGRVQTEHYTVQGKRATTPIQRSQANTDSIENLLNQAYKERDELNKKALERLTEIDHNSGLDKPSVISSILSSGDPMMGALSATTSRQTQARLEDPKYQQYQQALRAVNKRIKTLENRNYVEKGGDHGFWRSMWQEVSNPETWLEGSTGFLSANARMSANVSPHTESAQSLMRAERDADEVDSRYGDFGFWSRAGVMTGDMLPFMVDFMMVGGTNTGKSTMTKGLTKLLMKGGNKIAPKLVNKALPKWTVKVLGAMPEELMMAGVMTNTVQSGKTTKDVVDRKLGQVTLDEKTGTYNYENDKTWGSAIWQAEANSIIENYSEMFGTHLDGVIPWGKIAESLGAKRLSGVMARANASGYKRILDTSRKQFEKLGVSDYFGEVAEEYYGQLWRTMLNLDDAYQINPDGTRTNLLATGQFHGDIWGGMALSMGLMGVGKHAMPAVSYGIMRHQVNKADRLAQNVFPADEWEALRSTIDETTNENIGSLAEKILFDNSLNNSQREAAMNYMERSINLRGFNLGNVALQRGSENPEEDIKVDENQQELNAQYLHGLNISDSKDIEDVINTFNLKRQKLYESLQGRGEEDTEIVINEIDNDPLNTLQNIDDVELHTTISEYLKAKMAYEGAIQNERNRSEIEEVESIYDDTQVDDAFAETHGLSKDGGRGEQKPEGRAVMKYQDREVEVLSGRVVMTDDGAMVDNERSDKTIVVRDVATGKVEMVAPVDVLSYEEYSEDPALKLGPETKNEEVAQITDKETKYEEVAGDDVMPESKVESLPKYRSGEIKVRNSDGSETRGILTGYVDENGKYEYYLEGDLHRLHYASEDELNNILSEYVPYEIVPEEEQADPALKLGPETDDVRIASEDKQADGIVPEDKPVGVSEEAIDNGENGITENRIVDETSMENVNNEEEVLSDEEKALNLSNEKITDNEVPERISQTDNRADAGETSALTRAIQSIESSAAEGVVDSGSSRSESEIGRSEPNVSRQIEQARKAERFAKENGLWLPMENVFGLGQPGPSGNEADTYISGTDIFKVNNLMNSNGEVAALLNKVALHNEVFPNTAYDLVGFTGFEGRSIYPIVRQKYVENARNATPQEIESYMTSLGFTKYDEHTYKNSEYDISDLRPRNVLADEDGDIYVVDAEIKRHEATALEKLPRDEKDKPVFEMAESAEAAWDALVEHHNGDTSKAKVTADIMVENKRKAFEKAKKLKPKGNDPDEILASQEAIAEQQANAEREYLHWQQMASVEQNRQSALHSQQETDITPGNQQEDPALKLGPETKIGGGQNAPDDKPVDTAPEDKRADATPENKPSDATPESESRSYADERADIAKISRELAKVYDEVKDCELAVERLRQLNPETIDEAAAVVLSRNKILRDSHVAETGVGRGETSKMFRMYATQANGGVSIKRLAEDQMESECSEYGIPYDNGEARDALISVLHGALVPSDITHYIERKRIQEALDIKEQQLQREADAEEEYYQNAYHLSKEEYEAYEEMMLVEVKKAVENFDEYEYNSIIADEIANNTNIERYGLREIEEHDPAAESTGDGGGGEILPGEKPVEAGREKETVNRSGIEGGTWNALSDKTGRLEEGTSVGNDELQSHVNILPGDKPVGRKETIVDDNVEVNEETKQPKFFSYFTGSISDLISLVKESAKGLYKKVIAPISDNLRRDLAERGVQLTPDFKHVIDNNAIRHALKKHGGNWEEKRGQIPLSEIDFERIEDVVTNYDHISVEHGKREDINIVYSKTFEDGTTIYVEEKRDGRKELAAVTMWKKKNFIHTDANHKVTPISDLNEVPNRKVTNSVSDKQGNGAESSVQNSDKEGTQTVQSSVEAANAEVNTEPTPAQAEAGNYKKGHVTIGEFDITIENPAGSTRKGVDADGKEWSTTMSNTYGYIKGTESVDGDHIDVFLHTDMDEWNGRKVFVVDQTRPDGSFDEHKVMLGFNDKDDAMSAYLANYDDTWAQTHPGLRISETNIEDFNKWIESSHRKTKPFADYSTVNKITDNAPVDVTAPKDKQVDHTLHPGTKTKTDAVKQPKKKSKWISDEDASEFDNLRNSLRSHLKNDTDVVQEEDTDYGKHHPKPMDAEVLRLGTRMTYLMMKGGLRSFADYCEAMKEEVPDIFDEMRPHLKSLYAATQNMEDVMQLGWDEEMDDRKTVKAFDVYNFDKEGAKDIIATAQHIVDERASLQQTDKLIEGLKEDQEKQRQKEGKKPLSLVGNEDYIDFAKRVAGYHEEKRRNTEELSEYVKRAQEIAHEYEFESDNLSAEDIVNRINELQSMWEATTMMFGEKPKDDKAADALNLLERELKRWRTKDVEIVSKVKTTSDEANSRIDEFVERAYEIHNQYKDFSEMRPEHQEAFVARMDRELMEAADRMRGHLEEYYLSEGNSQEDARRMSRDLATRVIAETTLALNAEQRMALNESRLARVNSVHDEGSDRSFAITAGGEIMTFANAEPLLSIEDGSSKEDSVNLRKLEPGEFTHVERVFTESQEFGFTGGERIESLDDVAYLFRSLEDFSIENTFAVLVKDGKPVIVHLGMGNATSSIVDFTALRAAIDAYGADKIHFVHNHPSGNLRPSPQDFQIHKRLENMIGTERAGESLIIDVTSGRYSTFNDSDYESHTRKDRTDSEAQEGISNEADRSYSVKRLNKAERDKEGKDVSNLTIIKSPEDIARFVTEKRLGSGNKISYLLLAHNNSVIGNLHTRFENYEEGVDEIAEEMVKMGVRYGASSILPYGNVEIKQNVVGKLAGLVRRLSGESLRIRDVMTIGDRISNYQSAFDSGILNEPDSEYGALLENDVRFRDIESVNEQFNSQLEQQVKGTLPEGHIYQIGLPGRILRTAGFPNMAIEMSARQLAKKASQRNHEFNISDIRNLPKEIQTPIAVFRYGDRAKSENVIVGLSKNGKQFVVGVHFNQTRRGIEVSDIRGLFPKENAEWLNWISQGKAEWLDKEKIQTLIDQQRTNLAEVEYLDLDDVAKVIQNFENPKLADDYIFRENGELDTPALKLGSGTKTNDVQITPEEKRNYAEALSKKFNTPVRIVDDVNEITNADGKLEDRMRRSQGFYDDVSGEVVVVIPNNATVEEVASTVFHEVVAHKGLRELIGEENYDAFCDEIYEHLKDDLKQRVDRETTRSFLNDMAREYEYHRRVAVDEMFGRLSEKGFEDFTKAERGIWEKLKAKVLEVINKFLGSLKLPKWVRLGDNELRYMLWRSHEKLRSKDDYVDMARDIAKRNELGLNTLAEARVHNKKEDVNGQFNDQLQKYADGRLNRQEPFKLGLPQGVMKHFLPSLPIVMRQRILHKASEKKHNVSLESLRDMPMHISYPIFVFKRFENTIGILTEMKDRDGKNICVAIELDKQIQDGRDVLMVNDIRSVHGRNSINIIEPILQNGTLQYVDKEKGLNWLSSASSSYQQEIVNQDLNDVTKVINPLENSTIKDNKGIDWLSSAKSNSQAIASQTLDDVAKVIKNFENPIIKDEESFDYQFKVSNKKCDDEIRNRKASKTTADMIEQSYNAAISGNIKGKPIEVGRLTKEGREYLEKLSGLKMKDNISFVLNPSDLIHVYRNHYGKNEKDIGNNIPLTIDDIRAISEVVSNPERVLFGKEPNGLKRNMFYFFAPAQDGTYNLLEIYGDRKGNLTAKTFYKTRKGVSQRVLSLIKSEHLTSVTDGATLSNEAKLPKFFESGNIAEDLLSDYRFRNVSTGAARQEYDERVRTKKKANPTDKRADKNTNRAAQLHEAYLDSMRSLRVLQEAISHETGKVIESHEDAYELQNQMSSRNKVAEEEYERDYLKPMRDAISDICKGKEYKQKYSELLDYVIAKHGLERNQFMRARAKAKGKGKDKGKDKRVDPQKADSTDFAGLTALTGEKNVVDAEAVAAKMVSDYEASVDTTALWNTINAATNATLTTRYISGLLSRDMFDTIRTQYKNYIPLKGWEDTVAADVYEYATGGYGLSTALMKAYGRSSVADDPFANIVADAQRTIMESNRNIMKQRFLNLALNHQTDLLTVSKQWYVKQPDGTWLPNNPVIPVDADADKVDEIVKQHEKNMEELKKKKEATIRRAGLQLGLNTTHGEPSQHVVKVKRNGEEFCIYINGNPRAALAINGMLNPDAGDQTKIAQIAQEVKNFMSKTFTTWNPEFVISNLSRDLMFAGTAVAIKEDDTYVQAYNKNIWSLFIKKKAMLPRLLYKWEHGSLDDKVDIERYFKEFLRNGGETGFTQLNTVDKVKKEMEQLLREAQGGVACLPKKAWRSFWNGVEFMNRAAEDTTRFGVYMTSRKMSCRKEKFCF